MSCVKYSPELKPHALESSPVRMDVTDIELMSAHDREKSPLKCWTSVFLGVNRLNAIARPVEGLEDDDGRSERARCCIRQFELILCRHFLNSLELTFSKVPHDDLPPCSWASARLMAATSQENLRPFHFAGSWSSVGRWQFYPGARRGPLHHCRCKADADTAVAPSLQSCRSALL